MSMQENTCVPREYVGTTKDHVSIKAKEEESNRLTINSCWPKLQPLFFNTFICSVR